MQKLIKVQIIEVVKILKEMDFFEEVDAINMLPHPCFLKITFLSESMVEVFIDSITHINETLIKIVDVNAMPKMCSISISNLPPELIEQYVVPQLGQWGDFVKFSLQFIPKASGGKVQVGQSKMLFKLKDNCTIFDLPYFVKVMNFKIFLFIPGRPKICFRCSGFDHLVNVCPFRFCGVCRSLKLRTHLCSISYANMVVKSNQSNVVESLHDSLANDIKQGCDGELVMDKVSSSSMDYESEDSEPVVESSEESLEASVPDQEVRKVDLPVKSVEAAKRVIRTRSLTREETKRPYRKKNIRDTEGNVTKVEKKGKRKKNKNGSSEDIINHQGKRKNKKKNSDRKVAKILTDKVVKVIEKKDEIGDFGKAEVIVKPDAVKGSDGRSLIDLAPKKVSASSVEKRDV